MPIPPRPFTARAMLFVPGHRPERFEKAVATGVDAICIDLEDAVAPQDKATAREATLQYLRQRSGTAFVCLRLNGLRTPEGLRDLLALADVPAPDAVLLPKTESVDELRLASEVCGAGRQQWVPLIESARGLHQVAALATEAPDLAALMLGGFDFSVDIGASFTWEALLQARHQIVCAAALARVPAIDVPFLDIADVDGLVQETRRVAALGFVCKSVIHPAQVAPVQAAYAPSEAEIAKAELIVEAVQRSGGGAIRVNGLMVDGPVLVAAQRVLARRRA